MTEELIKDILDTVKSVVEEDEYTVFYKSKAFDEITRLLSIYNSKKIQEKPAKYIEL